jgi:hypothetical protein
MKSIAFGKSDCLIYAGGVGPPSEQDWAGYVSFLQSNLHPQGTNPMLIWTLGGAPSPSQRKAATEVIKPYTGTLKIAVVSGSAMARGILTAFSWFVQMQFRTFSLNHIDEALEYLEVPSSRRVLAKAMLENLKREVT